MKDARATSEHSSSGITVGILGPTTVAWDGHEVTLSSMSAVLALILAVAPGNVATSGEIQRKAWPEREPDDQTSARLRSAILAMRARFAAAVPGMPARAACPPYRAIVAGSAGYQLPAVETDGELFADLARRARLSLLHEDPRAAWRQTGDALRLWRGDPFADAGERSFAVEPALRLEQTRLAVELARCEAAILLGMHREVFPDLERLAVSWPGDFGITCLLVTALARCGRIGQAAEACFQALDYAHKHGLDDTAHRRLQFDALSGNIGRAGPPWRPGPG
jgi:DNA-binding SARP family transcriptional activator